MSRRHFVRVSIALVAFVLASCTRIVMPALVVGPMSGPPSLTSFERLVAAVRGADYEVSEVEPRYGSFSVAPHVTAMPGAIFEVQCYANGYVQLRISGVDRSPRSGLVSVPRTLRTEAVQLADVIHAGIGGPTR